MRGIIAYRGLNKDYTDKVSGIKFELGNTISIPKLSAETLPIMLLSTY